MTGCCCSGLRALTIPISHTCNENCSCFGYRSILEYLWFCPSSAGSIHFAYQCFCLALAEWLNTHQFRTTTHLASKVQIVKYLMRSCKMSGIPWRISSTLSTKQWLWQPTEYQNILVRYTYVHMYLLCNKKYFCKTFTR